MIGWPAARGRPRWPWANCRPSETIFVHEAERRLLDCLQALALDGINATGNTLMGGPSHVIAEQADVTNADVIVMGTHSRSGIAHLLIGSVTDRVIRHAPCPVLVVGEPKAAKSSLLPAAG